MARMSDVDVLIIGGGIAALWILDALDELGFAVALLEPDALGQGQTLASQGVIHGGLKYSLDPSTKSAPMPIAGMPSRWRQSLEETRRPHLGNVKILSSSVWLWRTNSISSAFSLELARRGLRSNVKEVSGLERPPSLRSIKGSVYEVDEFVLDTKSLVDSFRVRHLKRMIAARSYADVDFIASNCGQIARFLDTDGLEREVSARAIVLAAGSMNSVLHGRIGLDAPRMQTRPLHMVLVKGDLPTLYGHCIDRATTRITITTASNREGVIWQLGGEVAEKGIGMIPDDLIRYAQREVKDTLPDLPAAELEWSTYRINRAELACKANCRPVDAQCVTDMENSVLTVWPTKLALAPRLAEQVVESLLRMEIPQSGTFKIDAPRPAVGLYPWEKVMWSAPVEAKTAR